ncbi:MAG: HAD family hydrolase [Actinobacteria bacterium]|nr:HAD family hydrolase [Actinomycetota bacterium]
MMMPPQAVLFDLDRTLADTVALEPLRRSRQWSRIRGTLGLVREYPGMREVLRWLDETGVPTAVVTSSPDQYARLILDRLGWAPDVLVGYHATRHHKPHPEPLIHAAGLLGVPAREAVYVGDDADDVLAARRATMHSIAALWGARMPAALMAQKPDAMCTTPTALRCCLETTSMAHTPLP